VAVVGSGPSGCYTAKYLVRGVRAAIGVGVGVERRGIDIDVVERLPTPYGLVRNGVAPDHPEVKNVQNDFDALFDENNDGDRDGDSQETTTTHSNSNSNSNGRCAVRFYGNVTVGGDQDDDDDDDSLSTSSSTSDVTLNELRKLYDVVVLAYGCESDRELNLPVDVVNNNNNRTAAAAAATTTTTATTSGNPTIRGVLSARQFVNWYNGHPDFGWVTERVRDALWNRKNGASNNGNHKQSIVVVGHGNVALDCARILAKTREALDSTDLATRAIDVLRPKTNANANAARGNEQQQQQQQRVDRTISVVGRRGHVQGAFTIKELRELTKLNNHNSNSNGAELVVRRDELEMGTTETSQKELKASRPKTRIHKLLTDHAAKQQHQQEQQREHETNNNNSSNDNYNDTTKIHLRFLTNPVRYEAEPCHKHKLDNDDALRLTSVVCERTRLEGDQPGSQRAVGSTSSEHEHEHEHERLEADLCLVSIGYKGLPIDQCTREHFDFRQGTLRNDHGRVGVGDGIGDGDGRAASDDDTPLAPLYVSGWLKRGPSGIIGTNIGDARDTVASILEDMRTGRTRTRTRTQPNANTLPLKDKDKAHAQSQPRQPRSSLERLLNERNVRYVDWNAYRRIEDREAGNNDDDDDVPWLRHRKRHPDQPREKLVDREALLKAAGVD